MNIRNFLETDDLQSLKAKLLKKKTQTKRGTVTNAERTINAAVTEIERMLKRKPHREVSNIDHYNEMVCSEFDILTVDIEKSMKGKEPERMSSTPAVSSTELGSILRTELEEYNRTFSVAFNSLEKISLLTSKTSSV
jgi:hypothetical protein